MILISHRGNILGRNKEKENSVFYVEYALRFFDVEIDIYYSDNSIYLGHDSPQYKTNLKFLIDNRKKLWIHCKDYITFQKLSLIEDLNFFYHTDEDYVLTKKGYIWAYPGKPGGENTICVLPETTQMRLREINEFAGICSDYIKVYKND